MVQSRWEVILNPFLPPPFEKFNYDAVGMSKFNYNPYKNEKHWLGYQ